MQNLINQVPSSTEVALISVPNEVVLCYFIAYRSMILVLLATLLNLIQKRGVMIMHSTFQHQKIRHNQSDQRFVIDIGLPQACHVQKTNMKFCVFYGSAVVSNLMELQPIIAFYWNDSCYACHQTPLP